MESYLIKSMHSAVENEYGYLNRAADINSSIYNRKVAIRYSDCYRGEAVMAWRALCNLRPKKLQQYCTMLEHFVHEANK